MEFLCHCRCVGGDDDGGLPLMEPERPSDVRELCRCGMTNFGAGCGVHCGGMELADVCRVKVGRLLALALVTCIEQERIGAGTLFLGGMAGGGPRPCVDPCDCTRGGICGSFCDFDCSATDGRLGKLGAFRKFDNAEAAAAATEDADDTLLVVL